MSESSKAKAAGVSASSFLNLIGEVAKTTEEMKKAKAAGQKLPPSKPAKKPTVWARKNRGVEKRQQKDIELEIKSHKTYNSAIGTLERKVEIYNKLSKGQSAGLTEEQFKNLNVDFDLKAYESDDEVDESLTVPTAPMEDDPDTDYVDEYGRTRTAPRSQVPRQHLLKPGENIDADDDVVLYNPTRRVTYRAADHEEKKAQFLKAQLEQDKPPEDVHFDPTKHNREYGAGHIRFAQDNATRNKEMEELKKVHLDTKQARDASGAIDASVEGMSAPDTMPSQTSALKKRKLDMEARKQELKRRKGRGSTAPAASTTMSQVFTASTSTDPFASLERQATDVVDSFLSSVEEELRNKGQ